MRLWAILGIGGDLEKHRLKRRVRLIYKKEGRPPVGTHSELRLSGAVVPLPMRGISSYMPIFIRTIPTIMMTVPKIL